MKKSLNSLAMAIPLCLSLNGHALAAPSVSLEAIGTHTTGIFDLGAAEIVAHDARNQRIFKINAEAAGVQGTGIGCYFDDPTHELLGLEGRRWQSLYHFTVGLPVEDERLVTLPAYPPAR